MKELQIICRKYREENRGLKRQLEHFKNLGREMPDFMKGFKNNRRYND